MDSNSNDDNEWVDICRVCLGPHEEGFPLCKPCICAGTIGFVHQKCLEATIAEKRSNKCPVCHYTYKFKPKYADDAPEHLSTTEVISGLILRAAYKWIPFVLRLILVIIVWLGLLPLITSYMYQGWMHYPSSIKTRLERKLIISDIVSGLMITATIVISFLSLMSLVEHFRFNWQPRRQRLQQEAEEREAEREQNDIAAAIAEFEEFRRNQINNQQDEQRGQLLRDLHNRQQQQQNNRVNNVDHDDFQIHNEEEAEKNENGENRIVDEEIFEKLKELKNVGFEFNDKAENGFVTTDDDDESNFSLRIRKNNKMPSTATTVENPHMTLQYFDEIDEEVEHQNGENNDEVQRGKSIGVMDEGQVIISESASVFNQLSPQNLPQQLGLDQEDINDAFLTRNSSFYSIEPVNMEEDNFDQQDSAKIPHSELKLDDQPLGQSYTGTPRRRKSKRDVLKKQMLENIDTDSDDNGTSRRYIEGKSESKENERNNISPSRHPNGILRNKVNDKGDSPSAKRTKKKYSPIQRLKEERSNDDEDYDDHLDEEFERMMKLQEEAEQQEEDLFNFDQNDLGVEDNVMGQQNANVDENDRFEPQFEPLDPAQRANEDQMDMEGAMPIDEMIGIRGPISSLFRNLIWFIAFNTSYLGVFVFIPSIIGSITHSQFSQSRLVSFISSHFFKHALLLPFTKFSSEDDTPVTIERVLRLLGETATNRNNVLKPNDIGHTFLGYLALAALIFLMQWMVEYYQNYCKELNHRNSRQNVNNTPQNNMNPNNIHMDMRRNFNINNENGNNANGDLNMVVLDKLVDVMECAASITKVVILIFLKMVFLPFLLGLWLDVSTLELYKSTISERVNFAAVDVVAFFLLHWLVGITFMLTVTVSVLQFREVLHPDILSKVIRPQESQTDMIANLLQDDFWTHTKRIIPSIGIYAGLLALHIWLPAMLLSKFDLDQYMPIFQPKFWYFLNDQLQIPLELVAFHLSMLSILEKHKNKIGENQHAFLLNICHKLNLTDILLPRTVGKFQLRAVVHQVISPRTELTDGKLKTTLIDPFWEKLLTMYENDGATDELIEAFLEDFQSFKHAEKYMDFAATNGDASEPFHSYIALPIFDKSTTTTPSTFPFAKKLLPPRMGRFRFKKGYSGGGVLSIEIWQEVMGDPVPRPPAGWDYLGENGGAVEQGRWAWGKEAKSEVESSLAKRKHFFPSTIKNGKIIKPWQSRGFWISLLPKLFKILLLVLSCWFTVTCCVYGAISIPLAVGRCLYKLLGVPEIYIHDPFVFMVGCFFFFPIILKLHDLICSKSEGPNRGIKNLFKLLRSLATIPQKKVAVLFYAWCIWFIASPLLLGLTYDHFFLNEHIILDRTLYNKSHLVHDWAIGMALLHAWAGLCHVGAFQNEFWLRLGRFAMNDENDNNNNMNGNIDPNVHNNGQNNKKSQQGPLQIFIDAILKTVMKQEWDKVEKEAFLDKSLIPILKQLLLLFIVPIVASFGCKICIQHLGLSLNLTGVRHKMYRYFTTMTFVGVILKSYQSQIRHWFKSAHDAARDQRYLLGQILLDRVP